MRFRIRNTNVTLKLISWLQIIGGVTGLGLIGKLLLQTGTVNGPLLLIFIVGLSLFIFSLYSGKRLLLDIDKVDSIKLSLLNQLLQLFHWSLLGYGFSYSSGASLLLGFRGLSIDFNFSLIVSSFYMFINSDNEYFVKVNIVALFAIVALYDILKEKEMLRSVEN